MALFQRQPTEISQKLPYSLSLSLNTKTILVVGLGNPGKQYELTRHNIGFRALDHFAKSSGFDDFQDKPKFKGLVTEKNLAQSKIILLKPTTFMNDSGQAVQQVANFYKIISSDIVCVYDELSIPFGQIRMRTGGESAGHNGVKSLIQTIGPNFGRVRIGINNDLVKKQTDADFVLSKFTTNEQTQLEALTKEVSVILTEFIYSGQLPHDTIKIT